MAHLASGRSSAFQEEDQMEIGIVLALLALALFLFVTEKLPVEGGWLYRTTVLLTKPAGETVLGVATSVALCFVPCAAALRSVAPGSARQYPLAFDREGTTRTTTQARRNAPVQETAST